MIGSPIQDSSGNATIPASVNLPALKASVKKYTSYPPGELYFYVPNPEFSDCMLLCQRIRCGTNKANANKYFLPAGFYTIRVGLPGVKKTLSFLKNKREKPFECFDLIRLLRFHHLQKSLRICEGFFISFN